MKNLWWGYLHTSGTLQVKRYFSQLDIDEAIESPFCDTVRGPWEAENREEAINQLKSDLTKNGKTWRG